MSFNSTQIFTKENLDRYLNELSKEYKKLGGKKMPVEIILIGGAVIVENYGFREMTTDIDAVFPNVTILKEAINRVGDRYGLSNGWINADFVKTDSYSPQLSQYSVQYRTFNHILNVRMITAEYLIAMKLRAGRKYKNDLSDIVGILSEQEKAGMPIDFEMIDTAVNRLYGGWNGFSEETIAFIKNVLEEKNYQGIYDQIRESEKESREMLLDFQENYPGIINEKNIEKIMENRAKQSGKELLLDKLKEVKRQKSGNHV